MRDFKIISYWVIFISFTGALSASIPMLGYRAKFSIERQTLFTHQLEDISKISNKRKILIFGSSGVLYGISAEIIQDSINGVEVTNLSTERIGGQIQRGLSLILPRIQQGDILIIGDRDYRNFSNKFIDNFSQINFLPHFYNLFVKEPPLPKRANNGDFLNFGSETFKIQNGLNNYEKKPKLDIKGVQIMKSHIDSVLKANGCPVIVLIPILINPEDRSEYEKETIKLINQLKIVGISKYVLNLTALETDPTLFIDQYHLSLKGREKWTKEIVQEVFKRNICNLNSFKPLISQSQ
jgi:hypothetical protein